MAKLITSSDYGWSIPALFGADPALIAKAKVAGVLIEIGANSHYIVKYGPTTYASIAIQGKAITLAQNKTLGPQSAGNFKGQFETAIKKALAVAGTFPTIPDTPEVIHIVQDPLYVLPDTAGVTTTTSPGTAQAYFDNPVKKVIGKFTGPTAPDPLATGVKFPFTPNPQVGQNLPLVFLPKATGVYQPVAGTTSGSIYHVFAIMVGLNLAVRVTSNKFSVRAAGPKLNDYADCLKDFSMEDNKLYYSAHYSANAPSMIRKALGALIGRIGFQHVKEVADFDVLLGSKV